MLLLKFYLAEENMCEMDIQSDSHEEFHHRRCRLCIEPRSVG